MSITIRQLQPDVEFCRQVQDTEISFLHGLNRQLSEMDDFWYSEGKRGHEGGRKSTWATVERSGGNNYLVPC